LICIFFSDNEAFLNIEANYSLQHIHLFSIKNAHGMHGASPSLPTRCSRRIRNIMSVDRQSEPVKLGVTGGVGSGKSLICEYLAEKGITIVKTDDLARKAVLPGTHAYSLIVSRFGDQVIAGDGHLDRKRLREVITHDPGEKAALENIIHPEVFRLMAEAYEAARQRGDEIVAVEVPLLFEVGMDGLFDDTLLVCADRDVRIRRIMSRDQVTRDQAEALIGIQMPDEEKRKRAGYVIENNDSVEKTRLAVDGFYETFCNKILQSGAEDIDKGE
jgi:dephospho-CoA kinase